MLECNIVKIVTLSFHLHCRVVAWRRANKVGVNLLVTPKPDATDVRVGFVLRYDYTNTVATATESRTVTLNIPVMVDVGSITQS